MPDSIYSTDQTDQTHQMHQAHRVMFFIRPAKGLRIADPKTGDYLPTSGALMPRSGFWLRRLKDGDVVEEKQPEKAKPVTPQTEPVSPKDGSGGGKTTSTKKTA